MCAAERMYSTMKIKRFSLLKAMAILFITSFYEEGKFTGNPINDINLHYFKCQKGNKKTLILLFMCEKGKYTGYVVLT